MDQLYLNSLRNQTKHAAWKPWKQILIIEKESIRKIVHYKNYRKDAKEIFNFWKCSDTLSFTNIKLMPT